MDVTPTVLDLVGLPVPSGLDGVSLLPMVAHEGASATGSPPSDRSDALAGPVSYAETYYPRFRYNWSELAAMETERWKFIRAPRPALRPSAGSNGTPRRVGRISARRRHARQTPRVDGPAEGWRTAHTGATRSRSPRTPAGPRLRRRGRFGPARRTGPRPIQDGLPLLQELLQAQTDRDAGRLDDAARRLEALAQRDSENPAVFVALSSVYFRRNDADGAIKAAKRAVALDPESIVAVLDLAFAFRAADRLGEAATGFERVLALDPDNLKALLILGEMSHAGGELEKALGFYQRAVAVAPRLAAARIGLGAVALALNRIDVAGEALKQAVALGGTQPDLHFNLGVMAEQRGQRAIAAREYRAEVAAYPKSLGAWVNLGLLERQAGRVDAALNAFERAARAKADAIEGPYLMAETLASLGRRAEAERWAQEAHRRSPNEPRAEQLLQRIRRM